MTNKCTIISKLSHSSYMFRHCCVILRQLVINTLPSYTSIFCTMTNKCTIISQIITLLHVSTLSCNPQGARNQYLAKLHMYILYYDQQMHNYFINYHTPTCFDTIVSSSGSSQSIPCQVTHVYFVLWPTNAQLFQNYHTATCFDTIVSSSDSL